MKSGRQTIFSRLLRRTTESTLVLHNSNTLNKAKVKSEGSGSMDDKSKVLSAVPKDKIPVVVEESIDEDSDDELAGLDTKMFETRGESDSSDEDGDTGKREFAFTMTVSWMN